MPKPHGVWAPWARPNLVLPKHGIGLDNTCTIIVFCTYEDCFMEAKLTLKLDYSVIESAKMYAKRHRRSLSRMVENYFRNLSSEHDNSQRHSPIVESLTGILPKAEMEQFAREDERARRILRLEI